MCKAREDQALALRIHSHNLEQLCGALYVLSDALAFNQLRRTGASEEKPLTIYDLEDEVLSSERILVGGLAREAEWVSQRLQELSEYLPGQLKLGPRGDYCGISDDLRGMKTRLDVFEAQLLVLARALCPHGLEQQAIRSGDADRTPVRSSPMDSIYYRGSRVCEDLVERLDETVVAVGRISEELYEEPEPDEDAAPVVNGRHG